MNQFIVYRRSDKAPVDYRTGKPANAHDTSNWTDVATASAVVAEWGSEWGIGFVLTEQSHIGVVDVDGCRNPETGEISLLAQTIIAMLTGAYVEISISGKGIHIWFTYSGAMPSHASRSAGIGEFYHKDRYIAIGSPYEAPGFTNGSLGVDLTAALPALISLFFPPDPVTVGESEWTTEPVPEWWGPEEDGEIVRRAMNSKSTASAFGGKASFSDLWLCNEQVLSKSYPDPIRSYDASAADAALAQHLAFWVGSDCERIRRLMLQSGLVRDKWDREDYLVRTILGAVSRQVEWLQDERPEPPPPASYSLTKREGDGYCSLEQQPAHFAGCVYISSQHRALVPDGTVIKPETFKVRFGGLVFKMDALNEKTTRDAWEAWTQSQVYKCVQVEGTCFDPRSPFGCIMTEDKLRLVNTYMPVEIRTMQGDPTPFLTHLAKLLPDERDRNILLSYMAACVQYKGIKFQWAPLIQGAEGNGKTLLSRCVDYAIGSRYTEWPSGETLVSRFNSWLQDKIFIAVEDVHIPESKHHLLDVLKPLITNEEISIEAKGINQRRAKVCANFMFNTNHRDALRKTDDERRICPFFTAQQSKADIERDGMGGSYFPDLYNWLRADGFAIVADYLQSYAIPAAMDPTKDSQRAPQSSSHDDAVAASKGFVEQEIIEAIEAETPGFAGNFISSVMLDRHLESRGIARRIPQNKRGEILRLMGYVIHPALAQGRVNNTVQPDNSKPRVYVKVGSLEYQIPTAWGVAAQYQEKNVPKYEPPTVFKAAKSPSA
jgi:hypothetical protein